MSKQYLNATEKSIVLTLGAVMGFLEDKIELWEKLNRSKDLIKNAKMARTYSEKTAKSMLINVDEEQILKLFGSQVTIIDNRGQGSKRATKTIKGDIHRVTLFLKLKDEAHREAKRLESQPGIIPMDQQDLDNIIEFALYSCDLCESKGYDVKECKNRKLFIKYDAMPLNTDPGDTGCPFRKGIK